MQICELTSWRKVRGEGKTFHQVYRMEKAGRFMSGQGSREAKGACKQGRSKEGPGRGGEAEVHAPALTPGCAGHPQRPCWYPRPSPEAPGAAPASVRGPWGLIGVRRRHDIKKTETHMVNNYVFFNSDSKGSQLSSWRDVHSLSNTC